MPFKHNSKNAEELQVRKTAQRILMLHLRAGSVEQPNEGFWPDVDLDFSGATLVGLNLTHCSIRSIVCYETTFLELVSFRGTEFRTKADFNKAAFKDRVDFRGTVFGGDRDSFNGAVFAGPVDFGTKTAARLAGAEAQRGVARTWPPDWEERPIADRPDRARLTRKDAPTDLRHPIGSVSERASSFRNRGGEPDGRTSRHLLGLPAFSDGSRPRARRRAEPPGRDDGSACDDPRVCESAPVAAWWLSDTPAAGTARPRAQRPSLPTRTRRPPGGLATC